MIKTIFLDIDGTLRNSNKEITQKTKDVLKKCSLYGISAILCSGRSKEYAYKIALEACASKIVIASDGAEIYDFNYNKQLYMSFIPNTVCEKIYNISKNYSVNMFIDTTNGQFTNDIERHSDTVNYVYDLKEIIKNNKILHIHFSSHNYESANSFIDKLKNIDNIKITNNEKVFVFDNQYYVFVSTKTSCKGLAIKKYCEMFHISKNETMSFGDELNDIEMFMQTGYSIAMKNANPLLKTYATDITLSNDEDGVAIYLENYLKTAKLT